MYFLAWFGNYNTKSKSQRNTSVVDCSKMIFQSQFLFDLTVFDLMLFYGVNSCYSTFIHVAVGGHSGDITGHVRTSILPTTIHTCK